MELFVTRIDLAHAIDAEINSLTDEFGPDADSHVENHRRETIELLRQDPRFQAIVTAVEKSRIALRQQRRDVARKLQSNGVKENERVLNARMWTSGGYQRAMDNFISEFQTGERLLEVHWWRLVTNARTKTRDQIKRDCRMSVEGNDAMFERNFTSDADIREAEKSEYQREHPSGPRYGFNPDFPPVGRQRA